MQIGQTRYGAAIQFGAGVPTGRKSTDSSHQEDGQGCRSMDRVSTSSIEGGSFDPEAIDLLQAVLDETWASLTPSRRAFMSRSDVAKRVLELASRGERDRVRLCAFALTEAECGLRWIRSGASGSQHRS
jgi:hypothetical protein